MKDFIDCCKGEIVGATSGVVAGAVASAVAKIGAGIGIATGGTAFAATVPLGIVGGAILGLAGSRLGRTTIPKGPTTRRNVSALA